MFCKQCGNQIPDNAAICIKCGVATGYSPVRGTAGKSRIVYVLLGIFLGMYGIHNFFAGYTGKAIGQLIITLIMCWLVIPMIAVGSAGNEALAGWLVIPMIAVAAVWIWVIVEVCSVTQDAQGNYFS